MNRMMNRMVNGAMDGAINGALDGAVNDRPRSPGEDLAGCRAYTPALARPKRIDS